MNSGADVSANLELADRLLGEAAADGCKLAVLPENFALMTQRGRDKSKHAEAPGKGPMQAFLSAAADRHSMWIVGGSIPLASPDDNRVYGACVVVDGGGDTKVIYRKIHLFDVDLPGREESYRESHSMIAGDDTEAVDTPIGRIGLTICYDLRFPELFRTLASDGADVFTLPAAFTAATGIEHWHVLLRARAIENLAYVIAAGQYGEHPGGRSTFGHSLIVDPWGRIVAEQAEGNCHIAAEIDADMTRKLRSEFPVLANRRL